MLTRHEAGHLANVLLVCLDADVEALEQELADERWMHAACLTIAETGQKWGDKVQPSLAMQLVYSLKCEHTSLVNYIAELEQRLLELERQRGACEVCWTASWEPIEKMEDADGVNTIGPDQLARCGHCWMKLKLEQRLAQAEQRVKTHLSAFEEEAARADKAEQQVARLREGLVYIRETPMPNHQLSDYINVLLAEGRDE